MRGSDAGSTIDAMTPRGGVRSRDRSGSARAAAAMTVTASLAAAPPALAGPQDAPPPADASPTKDQAVAHFDKGIALYDKGAWAAALAEFLEARRIHPLRNALYQAGLCLEKLQQYDEALEQFEAMLREHGATMPASIKDSVQRKVVEMRGLVGEIMVGEAEPGATVTVDGLGRGRYLARSLTLPTV
jgi:tetratricopeptide (TPR) repeat protein